MNNLYTFAYLPIFFGDAFLFTLVSTFTLYDTILI